MRWRRPEPGLRVDPWRGDVSAVVDTFEWRQSSIEGGVARFQVAFLEAGQAAYPALEADHAAQAVAAAAQATGGIRAAFVRGFSVSGLAAVVLEDAAAMVGVAVGDISAEVRNVLATGEQVARWARDATRIAAEARVLIETPSTLADRMLALLGADRPGRTHVAAMAHDCRLGTAAHGPSDWLRGTGGGELAGARCHHSPGAAGGRGRCRAGGGHVRFYDLR